MSIDKGRLKFHVESYIVYTRVIINQKYRVRMHGSTVRMLMVDASGLKSPQKVLTRKKHFFN